ncbi:MAG TPA: hypothetical protein VHQ98_03505 [Gaiellaceae bacterium]|nr:hypothetical protein [Gaiellaceae bacterium]
MCDLFMPECLLDIDASGASVLHHFSEAFFVATEYRLPVFFFASAILALRHGALPKCPTRQQRWVANLHQRNLQEPGRLQSSSSTTASKQQTLRTARQ